MYQKARKDSHGHLPLETLPTFLFFFYLVLHQFGTTEKQSWLLTDINREESQYQVDRLYILLPYHVTHPFSKQ